MEPSYNRRFDIRSVSAHPADPACFKVSPEDAIKRLIAVASGKDPDKVSGLKDTPRRVFRALLDMTTRDPESPELLFRVFDEPHDEMVIVKNVDFTSLCEHHMMPFTGVAHVGYIPDGKVIGLSKIPRVVDWCAKGLHLQERLTTEVADVIDKNLKPKGVGVVIEATHGCVSCRGVKKQNVRMVTSCLRGAFKSDSATRAEFMAFLPLSAR